MKRSAVMASSLSFLHQPISENPFPSTIVSSSSISSHIGLSIGLPGVTSLVFPLRVSRGSSGKVRASEISNQTQDSTNLRSVDLQMTEVPLLSSSENSGVKISQVTYSDIHGTSASQVAVTFDCSATNPCSGIELQDVKLTYQNQQPQASCENADGSATGFVEPPSCF